MFIEVYMLVVGCVVYVFVVDYVGIFYVQVIGVEYILVIEVGGFDIDQYCIFLWFGFMEIFYYWWGVMFGNDCGMYG